MADTQPNPDISTGSSGMATPNTDQFPPMAVVADWGSDYRMVELGRMKPYCLQLDASLVEVMDSPPHLHMHGHQELWQTSSGQSCLTSMKLPLQEME